jgi:quercetin dioxygenase-like cupin family protein
MMAITPEQIGVTGPNDPYHFDGPLNRITITGNNSEDYRLVLFFIKKGTRMPLHDHPNMSVYFRLLFGELNYTGYDKVEEKFRYNEFSSDEYEELLQTKAAIKAKKTR